MPSAKTCLEPRMVPDSMPIAREYVNLEAASCLGPDTPGSDRLKSAFEVAFAALIAIPAIPLIALAMLLVKLTSRGPAIYRQERVGLRGRNFTIYKIRSMRADSERASGPCWASAADPRVTPIGRFLRKSHIDELPQLWNVLRGEMSLVGPRPERPVFVAELVEAIPHYAERLAIRPGVTGLAQVQLPPDSDYESVRRKLACDLYYARNRGVWLDLRIVVATSLGICGIPSQTSQYLLRIPGVNSAEAAYEGLLMETSIAGLAATS